MAEKHLAEKTPQTIPNLAVNADRLWASLMEIARIGGTPKGGCNRQALTAEDGEGRALFRRWCEEAGARVTTDPLGSQFARIEGSEDLPPVLLGSHLDTQPTGGKFDGVLGVLAGLEVLRVIRESGIRPRRPIEVVNWTNEEGCRFAPAMIASAGFAGVMSVDQVLDVRDLQGIRFGDALEAIGVRPDAPLGGREIAAYLELHIEQGPYLEAEGLDVGIVTGGQGLYWYDVEVTGFEGHAGATPMARRADALVAAAKLVLAIEAIGHEFAPFAVATVGQAEVRPNSRNVVPGQVLFTVDMRHADAKILAAMHARFLEIIAAGNAAGITVTATKVAETAPPAFDAGLLALLRREAEGLGLSQRDIISGAGHDAFHLNRIAPSAMIFTPCRDGISHNEAEDIRPEWARDGANLLLRAALRLAE